MYNLICIQLPHFQYYEYSSESQNSNINNVSYYLERLSPYFLDQGEESDDDELLQEIGYYKGNKFIFKKIIYTYPTSPTTYVGQIKNRKFLKDLLSHFTYTLNLTIDFFIDLMRQIRSIIFNLLQLFN